MSTGNFDKYISTHFGSLGGDNRTIHRMESLHANYHRVVPNDRSATVLDIGPGIGEFLQLLIERYGFTNVEAIDISAEVADYCSRLFCPTQHVEDPTSFLGECSGRYHLISLLHVLEHIEKSKLVPFLQAVRNALAPGGRVLIEVPNMANPVVGLTYRYADFTHELGFTGSSLRQVLKMAGFQQLQILPFRIPLTSAARLAQFVFRRGLEGALGLISRLYSADVELNSANIVAIAERIGAPGPSPTIGAERA